MPKLTIKTLNGIQVLESPPNGGWAWVVMPAGFILNGISWGTAKTLGAYFLDIQNEFSVSNAAVSWLISFVISILMFSGKDELISAASELSIELIITLCY